MHRSHLTLALSFLAAYLLQLPNIALAEARTDSTCGYRKIKVSYSRQAELAMSCKAISEVAAYFQSIGLSFEPKGTLTFELNVVENSSRIPVGLTHGYYDSRESNVVMTSSLESRPWGLRWTSELAASFLRHELVHLAVRRILGDAYMQLRPEWHEFIAYSVQFELMSPSLRDSILSEHSDVMEFESLAGVNEFTSRMDPAIFSIASYKTYRKNGSEELVRRLLEFELRPPAMSYPFMVLPGQIPE